MASELVKAVRSTVWLLVAFAAAVLLVVAVVVFDLVESRVFMLIVLTIAFAGPFALAYCYIVAVRYLRSRDIPALVVDPDHNDIRLKWFSPDTWADRVVEESLGTREGAEGTVYIAEAFNWSQKEVVDAHGDTVSVRVPELEGTWEAEVTALDFIERVRVLISQREKLVPKVREALDRKAEADSAALENTDEVALSLIEGTEEDIFMAPLDGEFNLPEVAESVGDERASTDDDGTDRPDPADPDAALK